MADADPMHHAIRPVKAARLVFPPSSTSEDALAATLGNCLAHLSANENCVLSGDDPEGVHQMRVALRRLDACLTLYKPLIAAAKIEHLQQRIKSVIHTLGPARDWDVFIGDILAPVAAKMENDADLKVLSSAARRQRGKAYRDVRRTLRTKAYATMRHDLQLWLTERQWRERDDGEQLTDAARTFATGVLDKAHRKLLKRGEDFAALDARARHKLRIRIKKLRYAAEFLSPLYDAPAGDKFLTALRDMQDDLGTMNDLESACMLIDGLSAGDAEQAPRIARAGGLVIG